MEEWRLRPTKVVDASSYKHRLFFALGNREIQNQLRLLGHNDSNIARLLDTGMRTGSLLSDLLVQPTAHYCVPLTRQVALGHQEIFRAGHGVHALSSNVETYREDLQIKKSEYPSRKEIFQNEELVERIVNELESFGVKMYRGGSIGELTGTKWKDAFAEDSKNEEGNILRRLESLRSMGNKEKQRLLRCLPTLPEIRGNQAFDWDYITAKLREQNIRIPPLILQELRTLLLRCYLASCKELYSCELMGESVASSQARRWAGRIERYDIQLFFDVAKALGVHGIILRLSASDIVDIKTQFDSFGLFREEYFDIVDRAKCVEQKTLESIKEELRGERETEAAQIRRVLERAEPLLVESAKELGILRNPSLLYYPERSPVYLFKKTFVDYTDMPFIRFKDELVYQFGKKLQSEAQEAIHVTSPSTYASTYHVGEVSRIPSDSISLMREMALDKVHRNIEGLVPKAKSPTRDEEQDVITAILRYAAQELVYPSFTNVEVTEKQFRKDITRYLQLHFGCPGVLREVQSGRGCVDALVMGVPLELKIVKERENVGEFVESSLPQVTEYIVGQCRSVGILCVLDISKRTKARPSLIDDVTVYKGRVEEGVDPSSEGIVAVVVIVIRGALYPSSKLR